MGDTGIRPSAKNLSLTIVQCPSVMRPLLVPNSANHPNGIPGGFRKKAPADE